MKIVCEKGSSAQQMLELVDELIGKLSIDTPILAEDMELDVSLRGKDGTPCAVNDSSFDFTAADLQTMTHKMARVNNAYSYDALTGLYNRGRYEYDIADFSAAGYKQLFCVYIDVVGLHEVNNHLGHQAGDDMLCSIAQSIKAAFPQDKAYRIGGDEFVVVGFNTPVQEVEAAAAGLQEAIRKTDFEVSVGVAESTAPADTEKAINKAEKSMRRNKADFYAQDGAGRQMRTLNHKLEKLLQEKQDANRFLNVIAPRYLGVYMVNPKDDSCRYIYIPKYFQKMLEENDGRFSPAIRRYYETFVREEYHEEFRALTDYTAVRKRLDDGQAVDLVYQKVDGSWVKLKITVYDQNTPGNQEMQWIFVDDTH